MPHTIFFSWQSDTPNSGGRTFIEKALDAALKELAVDATVEEVVRDEGLAVDRDTKGVPGSPPIVDTIFRKIDDAAAFVADMTFVGTRSGNKGRIPNPNVLVEYGYAVRSLTHSRVIYVMNTAYGKPDKESMPFDISHLRRPIEYCVPEGTDTDTKTREREVLKNTLKDAVRDVLDSPEFRSSQPKPDPPAKFIAAAPKDGAGRFRAADSELGVIDEGLRPGPDTGIKLKPGAAIWLRVMPDLAQQRTWKTSELRQLATASPPQLLPLGWSMFSGANHFRATDGFGFAAYWREEPAVTPAIAFAFQSGEVWSINSHALSQSPQEIPYVERFYIDALRLYTTFLRSKLSVEAPYRWIAGVEHIKGRRLILIPPQGHIYSLPASRACTADEIIKEGVYFDTDDAVVVLRPFFEEIYDQCGMSRPSHMDNLLG